MGTDYSPRLKTINKQVICCLVATLLSVMWHCVMCAYLLAGVDDVALPHCACYIRTSWAHCGQWMVVLHSGW